MDIYENFSKQKSSLLFEQWNREQFNFSGCHGESCWVVRDTGRLAPGVEEGGEGDVLWVIHGNQSTHPQRSLNGRREDRISGG